MWLLWLRFGTGIIPPNLTRTLTCPLTQCWPLTSLRCSRSKTVIFTLTTEAWDKAIVLLYNWKWPSDQRDTHTLTWIQADELLLALLTTGEAGVHPFLKWEIIFNCYQCVGSYLKTFKMVKSYLIPPKNLDFSLAKQLMSCPFCNQEDLTIRMPMFSLFINKFCSKSLHGIC